MRLFAISDLHLGHRINRAALAEIGPHPDDWLILAGDVGETFAHLRLALGHLAPRFARVIWVPGNHELWARAAGDAPPLRGVARYAHLVSICREHDVLTPEDPFPLWPGPGPLRVIAPLFLLYDYSFRPDSVTAEAAVRWASEDGVVCTDEILLAPEPFASRTAWCHARVREAEARLAALPADARAVLVNHWPLRRDLAHTPRIPRFSVWCGTRLTEDWHQRYRADLVVSGHLHMRHTRWRDDVRFEEVSLGYPRQWNRHRPVESYLRLLL